MVVNKITGERYQEQSLGSKLVLISLSTGVKRIIEGSIPSFLIHRKGGQPRRIKLRPEAKLIPDLVRSLQLEINHQNREGQKIFLRF